MRNFLYPIIAFMVLFSCAKEQEEIFVVPPPIQTLMASRDCSCDPYINKYTWNEQTVFVLAFKGPNCSWVPTYYDQRGEKIHMAEGYAFTDFLQESILVRNVWTCG